MPQIKNPQNKPYGENNNKTAKSLKDRIYALCKPFEFVRVINIDDEPFHWQFADKDGEDITFTDTNPPMKNVDRADPQLWYLNPGESDVIRGDNAYIMIEGLYKKLVAKKTILKTPDQKSHVARTFNWSDTVMQDEIIDRIFLGRENMSFNVEKDLDVGSSKQTAGSKA